MASPITSGRPTRTRRDRVLELLMDRWPEPVTIEDFNRARLPCPNVHVESLRFEGLEIERSFTKVDGRKVACWFLVEERWFDAGETAATREAA